MKTRTDSITFKSHTFKGGDKVTETFAGHTPNDAEIISIENNGLVHLRNEQGEKWTSNLVWLKPRKK